MGCPKLKTENWVFLRGGEKHLLFPRRPREKNRSRSAPAEMDGRWDLWGTEESGEKGCKSCKCCCVEDLEVFKQLVLDNFDPKGNGNTITVLAHRYTATLKFVDVSAEVKTTCRFKLEEQANIPMKGGYRPEDGMQDRTKYATDKTDVAEEWKNALKEQKTGGILEAFKDRPRSSITPTRDPGWDKNKFTLDQIITIYSSTDEICKGKEKCLYEKISIRTRTEMTWNGLKVSVTATDDNGKKIRLKKGVVVHNTKNTKTPWFP